MLRSFLAGVFAATITFTGGALAQASGTAPEAKALLEKAVTAVKADEKKAIADFNNPTGGFRDRDLYVFCAGGADNVFTAHANEKLRGTKLADLVDKKGKKLGEELIKNAAEGKFVEVDYWFPRPGQTEPVEKVTYVTKAGGQICGVGYYK
ncbi:chemotaxis protein [Rhodomicrobium udaipurense JA643]|jgi:signal transduction histidine kinase|uniref:Cache domain-containing protein n=1 Tax=Rhodomicrobium udaipurense TaxID=1202716 RepID=A0A8I1KHY7_9HYPH|nr:cache domain-containing protein [Rhodomicrobium udaipurense]KAI95595.1 chemotaxis protein [Rhodomicrobium udaipurense JA643]MBJ7542067.1 cache domain-containing protein [Rhodomicrobium udaipurense]